mgnify:CR=1 FL=1
MTNGMRTSLSRRTLLRSAAAGALAAPAILRLPMRAAKANENEKGPAHAGPFFFAAGPTGRADSAPAVRS